MHVRRPRRDVTQARRLERALHRGIVSGDEAQLVALPARVAERSHAIELIALNRGDCGRAAAIRRRRLARRHACVVEVLVAEERTVVTRRTLALADEKAKATHFLL